MNILNKNEYNKSLCGIIKDCEEKENIEERTEALSLLKEGISLYQKIYREKGKRYCDKKFPDIPKRIDSLVERLIEYKS